MDVVIYPFLKPNTYTQGFATLVHSYRVMHRICRFFTASCENGVRTHRREHQERRTPRFAGHDDVAHKYTWRASEWGDGWRGMGRMRARNGEMAGEGMGRWLASTPLRGA